MEKLTGTFTPLTTVSRTDTCEVTIVQSDTDSCRYLVKKVSVSSSHLEVKKRFCREMGIVSSLDHPNIIRPVDTLIEGNSFSIVYPYKKGKTLSEYIAEKKMVPELEALQIVKQLLSAFEYIHGRGIVHADVNPFNVYITDENRAMLLDFGLSMTEEEARQLPEGRIVGTFPYLAPEQMGFTDIKIDARTDLYCLLVVLYRMVAGKHPFLQDEGTLRDLLDATLKREVCGIRHVPQCLNEVLVRGLRPYPGDRYQTAEGLLWDVGHVTEIIKDEHTSPFSAGVRDVVAVVNKKRIFVERHSELDVLRKGFNRLLRKRGSYYLITGKSGIGKTEVVREFRETVCDTRVDFVSVKCNSFSPAQPYSIIRQLVIEYCIQKKGSDNDGAHLTALRHYLSQQLGDYSGLLCNVIPELRSLFDNVNTITVIEHDKESDRILHVLTTLLTGICRFRKTVFFIDDFQWVDKITFSIVERLMLEQAPCMLLCCYRSSPEVAVYHCFGRDLLKMTFRKAIHLEAFDQETIATVLARRFGRIHGYANLAEVLLKKTEGIPYVLTEALRYLVRNNILVYKGRMWHCDDALINKLPKKFDPVSMVLAKLDDMSEGEKRVLSVISLVEGCFDEAIAVYLSGKNNLNTHALMRKFEQFGFIHGELSGGYLFQHDHIKEAVASGLSEQQRFKEFERLGEYYYAKVGENGENIFKSAECYLKTRNLKRAVEVSYQAAFFATECVAFDVAVRYFKNVLCIADIVPKETVDPSVDYVKAAIAFGNVLMMTGAQEQALKIFHKILSDDTIDRFSRLEVVYKIGCIHHSTGAFEKSVPYFLDALRTLGLRIPERKGGLVLGIVKEVALIAIRPRWLPRLGALKGGDEHLLMLRILNKLTYSMYFTQMVTAMYVQLLASRLARDTVDSYEKAEAYSMHGIATYQLTRKKRAFWALGKAQAIAEKVKRSDMLAFSKSFSGLCRFYNASWKQAEMNLRESIRIYESIGDTNNQIISSEHLWKLNVKRGNLDEALAEMDRTIKVCGMVNEQYFRVVSLAALNYVMYLKTGVVNKDRLKDIHKRLRKVDSYLFHLEAGGYLLLAEIERGEYQAAYERATNLLPIISTKCINSEYQVRTYALLCRLISIEMRHRARGQRLIDAPDTLLRKQFIKYSLVLMLTSTNYPAYKGALYRNIAWMCAVRKRTLLAGLFFRKSIKVHHRYDMRFEEGCSRYDFAVFKDECCDRPGEARDGFNAAAKIFRDIGATMHLERCQRKTDSEEHSVIEADNGTVADEGSAHSSSGVNLVRFETLAEVSKTITETDDPSVLLRQILSAMITVTGAQYGCFFINKTSYNGFEPFALSFEGNEVPVASVPVFGELVKKVDEIYSLEKNGELISGEEFDTDCASIRSDLCIPLNWRDKYLGYVYLVNERVRGLFGEGAQKSAMILAAHAGILLENIQLIARQKKFNEHLRMQVSEQTEDIRNKTLQLEDTNLRLLESERMKGVLSGSLVHDIKNYAAGIGGNLEYLSRRMEQDQKACRIIDVVSETCSDISSLASNLLDIAKMDDGKMEVRPHHLDWHFFEAMCEKFGRGTLFEEKQIEPKVIPPGEELELFADGYLLERVMQNLFSNAAKYAPRGSSVEIRFCNENDEQVICFYNSGTPIPDSEKEALFEKYAQVKSRKSQYSKGLGLFFCRMVLNAHNGRMWLDTDEKGNYFKMSLPPGSNIIPFAAA